MCINEKISEPIVDIMYECFARLVKEKLESWVEDNNGWIGVESLSTVLQKETSLNMSNPSWAKYLLNATIIRFTGTLASTARNENFICFKKNNQN